MEFHNVYCTIMENFHANKFDIAWQMVRVRARGIKNPHEKISFALTFLQANPNIYNYARVLNWLKMTKVAYKDEEVQKAFEWAINDIENRKNEFVSTVDNAISLAEVENEDLLAVYKDLRKRKYGFQFKKVPKDHVTFMKELEEELNKRKLL